jgi:hypothetical protein
MFRGLAGPNDRKLNKHQARRRKQPKEPRPEKNNKYGDFDEVVVEGGDGNLEGDMISEGYTDDDDDDAVIVVPEESRESNGIDQNKSTPGADSADAATAESITPHGNRAAAKEIKHLLKRTRNVAESISLSAEAISNPMTWKSNVLNAVQNAVNEWRAINQHYSRSGDGLDDTQAKEPALATYMLIQQAMQSGPLTGSNPGYFKRCGAAVAKQALLFLEEACPTGTAQVELRFSEKQALAIEKFKTSARKAVESDKPPSKSQQKKHAGKGKKK